MANNGVNKGLLLACLALLVSNFYFMNAGGGYSSRRNGASREQQPAWALEALNGRPNDDNSHAKPTDCPPVKECEVPEPCPPPQVVEKLIEAPPPPKQPPPGVAVILEPRGEATAIRAILNALSILPKDWVLQIYTAPAGSKGHSFFTTSPSLEIPIAEGRVFVEDAGVQNLNSYEEMNVYMIMNTSFWESLRAERLLFFQGDSTFCSRPEFGLEHFLKLGYDHIGAPWAAHGHGLENVRGGNGGTSLRSKKAMIACSQAAVSGAFQRNGMFEDVYYSRCIEQHLKSDKVATREEMNRFSVEAVFHPRPFATHHLHNDIVRRDDQLREIQSNCPELRSVIPYDENKTPGHGGR